MFAVAKSPRPRTGSRELWRQLTKSVQAVLPLRLTFCVAILLRSPAISFKQLSHYHACKLSKTGAWQTYAVSTTVMPPSCRAQEEI